MTALSEAHSHVRDAASKLECSSETETKVRLYRALEMLCKARTEEEDRAVHNHSNEATLEAYHIAHEACRDLDDNDVSQQAIRIRTIANLLKQAAKESVASARDRQSTAILDGVGSFITRTAGTISVWESLGEFHIATSRLGSWYHGSSVRDALAQLL